MFLKNNNNMYCYFICYLKLAINSQINSEEAGTPLRHKCLLFFLNKNFVVIYYYINMTRLDDICM